MIWNSISGLRVLMVGGILLAYITAVSIIYVLVDDYYVENKPESRDSIKWDLGIRADAIYQLIAQSRKAVDQLAGQQKVRDLLIFGEADEIEEWASEARAFLPGHLGMALISSRGKIIGEPDQLRVGEACLRDMHRAISGRAGEWLLIHRDVPGQEHYDALAVVKNEDGENLGFLFASYRFSLLQEWLDLYTFPGEYTRLLDENGDVLVESGEPVTDAELFTSPLGNTRLTLELSKLASHKDGLTAKLVISSTVFFILIVLVPLIVFQRIWGLIRGDLAQLLECLEKGSACNIETDESQSNLRETREIVAKIGDLSRQLHQQQKKLTVDSLHDHLTGLPNRRNLEDYLEHICGMVHRGSGFRLALVDMDNFKQVNDSHGHQAGDDLLVLFSEVLEDVLRDADYAARYAGDEFVLLLYEQAPTQKSRFALTRMSESFIEAQKAEKPAGDLISTLSIGSVRLEPGSVVEPAAAVRKADEALYEAKRRGRNRIVDYSELESG
jgi:diguanylate cyclase (GGDEF)-like protein